MNIIKATVEKIEDFQKDDMKDALRLMGFDYLEMNFYRRVELNGDLVLYAELYDDAVLVTVYENNEEVDSNQFTAPVRFIDYIESILNRYDIQYCEIVEPDDIIIADKGIIMSATDIFARRNRHSKNNKQKRKAKQASQPSQQTYHRPTQQDRDRHDSTKRNKTTTRDLAKQLKRVDSSNVWAYAFQPKDEKVGDMLVQFKGKYGGPGDIYIYYNVQNKLWHRFYLADSKGIFFWKYIRNVFTYAKLTGDKKTHLPNGI